MEQSRVVRMVKYLSIAILIVFLSSCAQDNLLVTGNINTGMKITEEGTLDELLRDLAPHAKYALIIGSDGTAALLTSRSFSKVYIQHVKNTWNSVSVDLPAVTNINAVKEICIYQRETTNDNYFAKRLNDFEFLGQSSKNGYYVRKYKEISGN